MHVSNKKFAAIMGVLLLLLITQSYMIWMVLNPVAAYTQRRERGYVESASKMGNVPIGEFQFMAELGKTDGFVDLEALKKLSPYNAEVYKDAAKGDRAMAFASQMVLYRPGTNKIIYQGQTPAQRQLADQQAQVAKVVENVKAEGYLAKDSTEVPQVAAVANAEQLKNNSFYSDATDGDLVLTFGNANLVVLYSSKENKVINAARSTLNVVSAPKKAVEKTTEEQ